MCQMTNKKTRQPLGSNDNDKAVNNNDDNAHPHKINDEMTMMMQIQTFTSIATLPAPDTLNEMNDPNQTTTTTNQPTRYLLNILMMQ